VEQSKQIFDLVHQKVFEGFSEEEKTYFVYFAAKVEFHLDRMEAEQNRKGKDIKDEAVLEVCKTVFICIYHRADFYDCGSYR